jgi:hypothetical protein
VTAVDSVGDGIPDAWRAAHFGGSGASTNRQSCALCDPDHDGLNNWQEFLAGTDPTNSASTLKVGAVTYSGADITVSFQSTAGIVYRVEVRDALDSGSWSVLADPIPGTGGLIQIANPGAAILPGGLYRVVVLP